MYTRNDLYSRKPVFTQPLLYGWIFLLKNDFFRPVKNHNYFRSEIA